MMELLIRFVCLLVGAFIGFTASGVFLLSYADFVIRQYEETLARKAPLRMRRKTDHA